MGFLEDIAKSITMNAIKEMSKDENGKIDPYKAAGIAAGTGNFSSAEDQALLGAILGSEGAFDDDTDLSYGSPDNSDWRDDRVLDEISSGLDPLDYDTEEEYLEAVEEAEYGLNDLGGTTETNTSNDNWRLFYDYDFEHDIDPEDYDTEEEYTEALNEAKYGWRDFCIDGSDYGFDPEDYETEEEYTAAIEEAQAESSVYCQDYIIDSEDDDEDEDWSDKANDYSKETPDNYPNIRTSEAAYRKTYTTNEEDIKRCDFILQHKDNITAAKYLTDRGSFLYAQAVKEHFALPIDFPDEDECRETAFDDMIKHLYNVDQTLTLKIWDWCAEVFMPYCEYDLSCRYSISLNSLYNMYMFSDDFKAELIKYISEHNNFGKNLMLAMECSSDGFGQMIAKAIKMGMTDTAKFLVKELIKNKALPAIKFIENMSNTVDSCANYEELETMETFRDEVYPLILQSDIKGVSAYHEHWDREIKNYIMRVEMRCPQYAYTRRYAWRAKYKDLEDCPLSPERYESEGTFLSKLKERKVEWRRSFFRTNNHGVNPNDYENLEVFREAVDQAILAEREELKNDKTIYTYVGVMFNNNTVYHYRTNDDTIKIGDTVIVPVGAKNENKTATVVSVGQYSRIAAPFPVEKTKEIIEKVNS